MSRKLAILLVDDDPQVLRLVRANLEPEYRVLSATEGHAALAVLDQEMPDLVVLDIMLPGMDGYALCQRVREISSVPIIMLTAKVEDVDKVKGLKLGADDYVTKPFNVQELLARIEAVLRRAGSPQESGTPRVFTRDEVTIDFLRRRVTVSDKEVPLTLTEYKLLLELVTNAGRIMMHKELLTRVWGIEYQDESEYLRAYIRHLRQKIEPDPHEPKYILSKPGIGYMFVG